VEFRELSDDDRELIKPHSSSKTRTGGPRADDRRGLIWHTIRIATDVGWMDMYSNYGSYKTAWKRLKS
jgi:hypothetical protein